MYLKQVYLSIEKEKELKAKLTILQALKAKKVESLQETKKQFDQQKITAAANEIEQELNNSKKILKEKKTKRSILRLCKKFKYIKLALK